jgi:hypothetical protein
MVLIAMWDTSVLDPICLGRICMRWLGRISSPALQAVQSRSQTLQTCLSTSGSRSRFCRAHDRNGLPSFTPPSAISDITLMGTAGPANGAPR